MDQGNALGLGGEEIIVAAGGDEPEQLAGAGLRQLCVAEADERADIQVVRDLTDGKLAVESGHMDRISKHNHSFCRVCGTAVSRRTARLNFTVCGARSASFIIIPAFW